MNLWHKTIPKLKNLEALSSPHSEEFDEVYNHAKENRNENIGKTAKY